MVSGGSCGKSGRTMVSRRGSQAVDALRGGQLGSWSRFDAGHVAVRYFSGATLL